MSPSLPTQLTQLAHYLAGEFDNKLQSLADPTWYLHLRVWNRPLPPEVFGDGYGFFIEQISVATGAPPYRQRLLHLTLRAGGLWGQYYGLQNPLTFQGCGLQPDRLAALTPKDLIPLPTCGLAITLDPLEPNYQARLPDDTLCCITYQGQASYIRLGFDIGPLTTAPDSPIELRVYDRGIDPTTGNATWGPAMGPFCLQRQQIYGWG